MSRRRLLLAITAVGVLGTASCSRSEFTYGAGGTGGVPASGGATGGGGMGGAPEMGGAAPIGGSGGIDGGTGGGTGGLGTCWGGGSGGADTGGTPSTGGSTLADASAGTSPGPSCAGMAGTECNGESCCTAMTVPAGTFPMGRLTEDCSLWPSCTCGCPGVLPGSGSILCDADEQPEHSVAASAFSLDKYEVTVGRFRKFVEAYPGSRPVAGAGAHPTSSATGWQSGWDSSLAADQATLIMNVNCNAFDQTWTTTSVGGNETKAMNCVSWYEAFAFCAWDGGFLPTEAEWECAAAGGNANRLFPWGSVFTCAANLACPSGMGEVAVVGSFPGGQGLWRHMDLVGNVSEWTLDWYSPTFYTSAAVADVVNLTDAAYRAKRGGDYGSSVARSASRSYDSPSGHFADLGFRCARTP